MSKTGLGIDPLVGLFLVRVTTARPSCRIAERALVRRRHTGGASVSYEIAFYQPDDDPDDEEAGEHFHLCSISGWSAFVGWAAKLSAARYPALVQFCRDGCIVGSDALSTDLRRALRSRPPESKTVRAIGKTLLSKIGVGALDETAVLEI
jgi:hypothetical protein